MKLKGIEPFQAKEAQPVDYEAELAKFVKERSATQAVNSDMAETPTEDPSEEQLKQGLARLLDFVAAKQNRGEKDSLAGGNIAAKSLQQKATRAYLSLDEMEETLLIKGRSISIES